MFLAFLLALLGAGALVSGLTYILFWYEAANTPHPSHAMCHQDRGSLAWCVVVGFLSSVSSQLMVYLTYPLGLARGLWKPAPSPDCERPPVLLVHGLYHNASAWYLYKWWLRRRGFKKVFAWGYDTFRHDFWQLAEQMKAAVAETANLCGGQPAILIGHSMGGLLARAAIADRATAAKVRAVVVLGAPHMGSKLSALAINALGRSLAYGGCLVRRLGRMPAPGNMPKLNVFSPLDNMVLPTSSLEISGDGWAQAETAPISHVSMLYHVPTVRLVMEYLDEVVTAARPATRPATGPVAGEDCPGARAELNRYAPS